jgi:hypothetical protein
VYHTALFLCYWAGKEKASFHLFFPFGPRRRWREDVYWYDLMLLLYVLLQYVLVQIEVGVLEEYCCVIAALQ